GAEARSACAGGAVGGPRTAGAAGAGGAAGATGVGVGFGGATGSVPRAAGGAFRVAGTAGRATGRGRDAVTDGRDARVRSGSVDGVPCGTGVRRRRSRSVVVVRSTEPRGFEPVMRPRSPRDPGTTVREGTRCR
ncbi:hypothetical protein FK530_19525, partial [Tsukamurella conjunctivitidis]